MSIGCSPQATVSKGATRNLYHLSHISESTFLSRTNPGWWTIYAGDVDLQGNGEIYIVDFFIVHEGFDASDQYVNDIALVRVSFYNSLFYFI
jgi:hypothetical protein